MSKIQTGIRIEETLYGKLKEIARIEGRTVNNLNEYIIRRFVTEYEAKHGPVAEYEE
jgi:predicted DNA-binding ribbon-helix-helix protein